MRAFLLAVASVLIIAGVIIGGAVLWRVWVDSQAVTVVPVPDATSNEGAALRDVEIGGMSLQTPAPQTAPGGRDPVVNVLPETSDKIAPLDDASQPTAPVEEVTPTPEGCVATTVPGLPVDTPVYARGTVRIYNEPDVDAPTQGEYNSGAIFYILATGEDGGTAIERCGLRWYRVRISGAATIAVEGWVLADAVDDVAPVPTPPTATPGCLPQQPCTPCCQPNCYEPCVQPCCQDNSYPCDCWDYPRG